MLSQKEAVYQATLEVLSQANLKTNGLPVSKVIPKELRKMVTNKVLELVKQGQVAFKGTASNSMKHKDSSRMSAYVSGLVSNHWKRDPRLNGSQATEK